MSINHLRGYTLKPTILMDQKLSNFAGKKIKSVNTSHDLPSTSCNVMAYMHFLPAHLLNKIKVEPNLIEHCLENIDGAIQNNAEKNETKAKCAIIKLLLQGSALERAFERLNPICFIYRANLKLIKKEALALMLEYYLVGGLKLLRGFPCTTDSLIYPALVMNFILLSFEKNPVYTDGVEIKEELKQIIAKGEFFENISVCALPTALMINDFITACEYKKDKENHWFLSHSLTECSLSISYRKSFAILPKLQQIETTNNAVNSVNVQESACQIIISCSEPTKAVILANLEAALDNSVELYKNKIKFTAVKMLLSSFTYKQIIRHCGSLYIDSIERNISWNPQKLDLLLQSYFLGGLQFVRAFSLQSRLTVSQLKIIKFLITLIEANPTKGSTAILSTFNRMKEANRLPLTIDKSSCLPSNDVFYNFLLRCGYKRIAHQWIWNGELTPNIFFDDLPLPSLQPINSTQSIAAAQIQDSTPCEPSALCEPNALCEPSALCEPNAPCQPSVPCEPSESLRVIPPSFDFASLADKATTVLLDEKMIAHEKALKASAPESEKDSLTELTRLMLSFESLSSCSSKYSLDEISDHIENNAPNLFESQNIEPRLPLESNELAPLPNIDSRDLFDFFSQYDSQEGVESQCSEDLHDFSHQSYSQKTQALPSVGKASISANKQEQIAILTNAIDNDAESELNKVKFSAVKMLLEEKYSYETIAKKCHSLFNKEQKNSKAIWTRENFMSLKRYYLHGGLTLLRGFSFKSLSASISAEIMGLIIKLVEENPQKGSMAIVKMLGQINTDMDIPALPLHTALPHTHTALPLHTVVEKFLIRAGYQRIQKKWVFDARLTANILPNKTTKRQSNEVTSFSPLKKIRAMSTAPKSSFLNQENLLQLVVDNLNAAIGNETENVVDKNKFTAVKMLLDGANYEEILTYCNFPLFGSVKKNMFWTPEKLELLLDGYLQGGLCLVRGFSFRSHHDVNLQKKMGFIMRLVHENPDKGSTAILNTIRQMIKMGEIPEGINVTSLPSHGALDAFITRCGYDRIPKQRWVFKPDLTPNLPFYGLQREQIAKQIDLKDQAKIVSKQSSKVKIKFKN